MAKTLFIVGHAKPPKGMSAADIYSTLSLALWVEDRHGVILDASCSLVTETGKAFVRQLLVGQSLLEDGERVLAAIGERYLGAAQAAIQAAWKDAVYQFQQHHRRGLKVHNPPVSSDSGQP